MIWNCQHKATLPIGTPDRDYYIHRVTADNADTARVRMFNLSMSRDWLDPAKTLVWSSEDWRNCE